MKSFQIILVLFLLSISGFSFSQSQNKYDFVLEVNKNLPDYGFTIEKTGNDSILYHNVINIYQADSDKFIQSINLDDYDIYYSEYEYPDVDPLIDVNFDGYKDLCILAGSGQNGKNQLTSIFLFDTTKAEFYKSPYFNEVYNLYVVDLLKCIYEAFWTGACADAYCIINNTYKVLDKKLIKVESDYYEYDDKSDTMHRYIEKYENGKLISKTEVGLNEDVE